MKYLVVCNHNEVTVDRQNPAEAVQGFRCRYCVKLDPETKAVTSRNVRVYLASEDDVRLVEGR